MKGTSNIYCNEDKYSGGKEGSSKKLDQLLLKNLVSKDSNVQTGSEFFEINEEVKKFRISFISLEFDGHVDKQLNLNFRIRKLS